MKLILKKTSYKLKRKNMIFSDQISDASAVEHAAFVWKWRRFLDAGIRLPQVGSLIDSLQGDRRDFTGRQKPGLNIFVENNIWTWGNKKDEIFLK